MLDTYSQSQAAKATAQFVRVWALAATTPAIQTMRFWTRMLAPPAVPALADTERDDGSEAPAPDSKEDGAPQAPAVEDTPNDPGFASYRSPSGYAVAQIIIPEQRQD